MFIVCQYQTRMCIVCPYQTVSGQVCLLSVNIRQFRDRCVSVSDRYVYFLSVSGSFWIGKYIVCQYQIVSGQVCLLSVSFRQLMYRCVYSLSE